MFVFIHWDEAQVCFLCLAGIHKVHKERGVTAQAIEVRTALLFHKRPPLTAGLLSEPLLVSKKDKQEQEEVKQAWRWASAWLSRSARSTCNGIFLRLYRGISDHVGAARPAAELDVTLLCWTLRYLVSVGPSRLGPRGVTHVVSCVINV